LALWRVDPEFRRLLADTREQLVTELMPLAAAESARRAHFSRWKECLAAPLDLEADTLLGLIQQMSPDDWHELALGWDWNWGAAELEWITAQRTCDRATAVFVLCLGRPGDVARQRARRDEEERGPFIRDLAARIEGGFYPNAEFGLDLPMRQRLAFEAELATARATGVSPWQIPDELLSYDGVRAHEPRYAVSDGRAHFEYEFWLRNIAPAPKR
jgi:hypothetical protein